MTDALTRVPYDPQLSVADVFAPRKALTREMLSGAATRSRAQLPSFNYRLGLLARVMAHSQKPSDLMAAIATLGGLAEHVIHYMRLAEIAAGKDAAANWLTGGVVTTAMADASGLSAYLAQNGKFTLDDAGFMILRSAPGTSGPAFTQAENVATVAGLIRMVDMVTLPPTAAPHDLITAFTTLRLAEAVTAWLETDPAYATSVPARQTADQRQAAVREGCTPFLACRAAAAADVAKYVLRVAELPWIKRAQELRAAIGFTQLSEQLAPRLAEVPKVPEWRELSDPKTIDLRFCPAAWLTSVPGGVLDVADVIGFGDVLSPGYAFGPGVAPPLVYPALEAMLMTAGDEVTVAVNELQRLGESAPSIGAWKSAEVPAEMTAGELLALPAEGDSVPVVASGMSCALWRDNPFSLLELNKPRLPFRWYTFAGTLEVMHGTPGSGHLPFTVTGPRLPGVYWEGLPTLAPYTKLWDRGLFSYERNDLKGLINLTGRSEIEFNRTLAAMDGDVEGPQWRGLADLLRLIALVELVTADKRSFIVKPLDRMVYFVDDFAKFHPTCFGDEIDLGQASVRLPSASDKAVAQTTKCTVRLKPFRFYPESALYPSENLKLAALPRAQQRDDLPVAVWRYGGGSVMPSDVPIEGWRASDAAAFIVLLATQLEKPNTSVVHLAELGAPGRPGVAWRPNFVFSPTASDPMPTGRGVSGGTRFSRIYLP